MAGQVKVFACRVVREVTTEVVLYVQAPDRYLAMEAAEVKAAKLMSDMEQSRKAITCACTSVFDKDVHEVTDERGVKVDICV